MELAEVCMLYCYFKDTNRITNTLNILEYKTYCHHTTCIYVHH
jgi:hypothetical protein